ncbi:hypothetical protein JHK87_001668 [Glycine soja]|nr:hypothetical protein JHK87_001668 [Glycine soja]
MDPTTNLVEFSSQNLEACTNNFSQNNLIGLTQFGRLYRGNLEGNLNWLRRINVIHELAKLLKFIHDQEKQNMVLNISASHILLDKFSTLLWQ